MYITSSHDADAMYTFNTSKMGERIAGRPSFDQDLVVQQRKHINPIRIHMDVSPAKRRMQKKMVLTQPCKQEKGSSNNNKHVIIHRKAPKKSSSPPFFAWVREADTQVVVPTMEMDYETESRLIGVLATYEAPSMFVVEQEGEGDRVIRNESVECKDITQVPLIQQEKCTCIDAGTNTIKEQIKEKKGRIRDSTSVVVPETFVSWPPDHREDREMAMLPMLHMLNSFNHQSTNTPTTTEEQYKAYWKWLIWYATWQSYYANTDINKTSGNGTNSSHVEKKKQKKKGKKKKKKKKHSATPLASSSSSSTTTTDELEKKEQVGKGEKSTEYVKNKLVLSTERIPAKRHSISKPVTWWIDT